MVKYKPILFELYCVSQFKLCGSSVQSNETSVTYGMDQQRKRNCVISNEQQKRDLKHGEELPNNLRCDKA